MRQRSFLTIAISSLPGGLAVTFRTGKRGGAFSITQAEDLLGALDKFLRVHRLELTQLTSIRWEGLDAKNLGFSTIRTLHSIQKALNQAVFGARRKGQDPKRLSRQRKLITPVGVFSPAV